MDGREPELLSAEEIAEQWGLTLQEVYALAKKSRWAVSVLDTGGLLYRQQEVSRSILLESKRAGQ